MKTHKNILKGLSIYLILAMVITAFAATAFAAITPDTKGTISVSGVEEDVTVSVYKLMDVNVDASGSPQEPVYSWTDDLAGWIRTNYPQYIGNNNDNSVASAFNKDAGASEIASFYDKLAAAVKGNQPPVNSSATRVGSGNIENLPMGNYLILIENGMKVYSPSAVNLVPTWNESDKQWNVTTPAAVTVKASDPSITKTVKASGSTGKESDNANIGDTLTYDIVADIPHFPSNSHAKNYVISDDLSSGITLDQDLIKVWGVKEDNDEFELINGSTVYYTKGSSRPGGLGTTEATDFTLTFDYSKISEYVKIHISYEAVLNGNAVLGSGGNINTAYLDYSNNPYSQSSLKTKTDSTHIYTYGINITKVEKENHQNLLSGASFELYASEDDAENGTNKISFIQLNGGEYRKAMSSDTGSVTTLSVGDGQNGDKGKLLLKGLDEGKWYLKETTAPGGYNLLAGPVEVEIADLKSGVIDGKVTEKDIETGLVPLIIENDDGFQLPVTGGMGTVLFTAIGIFIMGVAVLLMIVAINKKKSAKDSQNH